LGAGVVKSDDFVLYYTQYSPNFCKSCYSVKSYMEPFGLPVVERLPLFSVMIYIVMALQN